MNNLTWNKSDKNYIAKSGDFVFRLKYQDIGVYGYGKCYSLQARCLNESEFKYLSYAFVIKNDGYRAVEMFSVGKKLWINVQDILNRTESILKENMYL